MVTITFSSMGFLLTFDLAVSGGGRNLAFFLAPALPRAASLRVRPLEVVVEWTLMSFASCQAKNCVSSFLSRYQRLKEESVWWMLSSVLARPDSADRSEDRARNGATEARSPSDTGGSDRAEALGDSSPNWVADGAAEAGALGDADGSDKAEPLNGADRSEDCARNGATEARSLSDMDGSDKAEALGDVGRSVGRAVDKATKAASQVGAVEESENAESPSGADGTGKAESLGDVGKTED
jgi:hypothetical protein